MAKSTEKETQAAVIEYLTYKGIFHYRNNSGAFKTESGGFYRMGMAGAPDIICVVEGVYVGLEIKDVKGKLNENQILFKERLEKAGGIYLVIRSIDEVIEYFK